MPLSRSQRVWALQLARGRGDLLGAGESLPHAQAARAGGGDEPSVGGGRQQTALAPARRARHPDAWGVMSLVVARCHGGPV